MNFEIHLLEVVKKQFIGLDFNLKIYIKNDFYKNELIYISRNLKCDVKIPICEQIKLDKIEKNNLIRILFDFNNDNINIDFICDLYSLVNKKIHAKNYYLKKYKFIIDEKINFILYFRIQDFNDLFLSKEIKNEENKELIFNEKKKLKISEITPLMLTFPNKITPSRKLLRAIENIFWWKNFSLTMKIYIYLNIIIALPFLFLIILLVVSLTPLKVYFINSMHNEFKIFFKDNEPYTLEMKNNMNYIQDQMLLLVNINKSWKQIFYNNDKSIYYRIINKFYLIVPGIVIFYYTFNLKFYLHLFLYLIFIENKFKFSKRFIHFLKYKFFKNINYYYYSNNKSNDSKKAVKRVTLMKKVEDIITLKPKSKSRYLINNLNNIMNKKEIILIKECFFYENERWFMGVWAKSAVPFERGKYSNITGDFNINEKSFNLYNNYEWDSVWKIETNNFTDKYGHEYSKDFKCEFSKKQFSNCYVRRKKIKRISKLII